ncbi:MAG TPA: RNA polymerase sigma factor [Candidatus Nanoarchaeia archaeon]|nr:RNA polymerase sigma factor [Candidatus Nanoarchaeia archaeon]
MNESVYCPPSLNAEIGRKELLKLYEGKGKRIMLSYIQDHYPALRGGRSVNGISAEDIFHEAISSAWNAISQDRYAHTDGFYNWMYTIIGNKIKSMRRKDRAQREFEDDFIRHCEGNEREQQDSPSIIYNGQRERILGSALAELPREREEAIRLQMQDFKLEEIAEMTDVELGTVKTRIFRGKQALKKKTTLIDLLDPLSQ